MKLRLFDGGKDTFTTFSKYLIGVNRSIWLSAEELFYKIITAEYWYCIHSEFVWNGISKLMYLPIDDVVWQR